MATPLLALVFSLSALARADTLGRAVAVVHQAVHAVEGDSVAAVRARWAARLDADSADRAALLGLASLARLTYDYPASERLYTRLFGGDSPRHDGWAAYARLGHAWSFEERGLSDAAADEFSRARRVARAAGDRAAEAEALIGLSFARGSMAGMSAALAIIDSAGPLIPAAALDLQAERGWRRAMIRALLGDSGATVEAAASVELARRSGELRVQAQAYRGLARVLDWRGREDSARAAFEAAERRFRQARDRSWLAVTLMNRGNFLRKLGDLGETIDAFQRTEAEGELSRNLWAVASANTGLGVVAIQLNDFTTAKARLERAVTMFEAQGDRSSAMNARKFLPLIALARGEFAAAREQTLEALAFYQRTGETLDQLGAYQMLATIAMREGDWPGAERSLARAQALLPRLEGANWGAELDRDRGRLALARGDAVAAEHAFTRLLGTLDSTRHLSRYDARLRLADAHARRHDLDGAEREATAAWDELDRWRATLSDRELRLVAFQAASSEYQASPANLSEQRASVARVLAALATGGRPAPALALAERRRARELMDQLARGAALRTGVPDSAAGRPAVRQPSSLSAEGVAGLITDPHTAILEYVTGGLGAPTTLWVVTRTDRKRDAVRASILAPADSLAGELTRFLALLQRGEETKPLALAFGRALLEPAVARLDTAVTRLIIVPDGPLHRVPWDALRLADGRFVVERYAVSVTPSIGVLATLWGRPRDTLEPNQVAPVLAFGDPAFGPRQDEEPLPRLSGSGREAQIVSRYSPEAELRLERRATARYLKQAPLERFRVIHFATHALVDERSAARSELVLAPEGDDDGRLRPGDLAALRLNADLVLLSGCRTASGVLVEGEGVQGLTAPLLQSGARSVVASQWRIADRSSVGFIEDFYRRLARGLAVGDALRETKLDALGHGAPAREWAAFTAVGDPLVSVALRKPHPALRWIAGLMAALAVAAAGVAWSRGRSRGLGPKERLRLLSRVP